MPDQFIFPHRGKTDERSLRTKEAALEAFLRGIEAMPGPPGPPGPPGTDGADGADGAGSAWYSGPNPPSGGPNGIETGSWWLNTTTGDIYQMGASAWSLKLDMQVLDQYTHVQASPASVWTINHALQFRPGVTVVDSAGEQVEGSVDYIDGDTLTISFSAAFSGTAYLS